MKECYARMIANDFENDITTQWLYGKSMEEKWVNEWIYNAFYVVW